MVSALILKQDGIDIISIRNVDDSKFLLNIFLKNNLNLAPLEEFYLFFDFMKKSLNEESCLKALFKLEQLTKEIVENINIDQEHCPRSVEGSDFIGYDAFEFKSMISDARKELSSKALKQMEDYKFLIIPIRSKKKDLLFTPVSNIIH